MSEAERRRRLNYKKNRKKCILIQGVVLVVVALIILSSVLVYNQLNKTYYIDYIEDSSIDYRVQLKPNEFYEDEWQPSGQGYVSTLINSVLADFKYELNMDTKNVDYDYSYRIDAQLEVMDSVKNVAIYDPIFELKPEQRLTQSSNNKLVIDELVAIDYIKYNELATDFVKTYGLTNTKNTLKIIMSVNVIGSSDEFEADSENKYTTVLSMPITDKTVNVEMTSSVPTGESKVLACKNAGNQEIFKWLAVGFGILELLGAIFLVAFIYLTRNHDINYSIKVQRLFSNYRSFIQKITNGFDTKGYQILIVSTFNEMLAIRDTIQSPVLMSENTDQTRTQFFIPTNTKILYMYEIKVDNYDELYSNPEWTDDSVIVTDIGPKVAEEIAPKLIDDVTPRVVERASERVEEVLRSKAPELMDSVVKEATPIVVKEAASRVNTREASSSPLPEITYDKAADLIVSRLINRLAEAERENEAREERLAKEQKAAAPVAETVKIVLREKETALEEPKAEEPVALPVEDVIAEEPLEEDLDSADDEQSEDEVYEERDEAGNRIIIHFSRSVSARIIQSNRTVKNYYSELKNYILSYKGVKCRTSWKYESYNKGRAQLFKLKIRGKTILLYCALDPADYEYTKYFHKTAEAKIYRDVPMLVRIKSERGLKRAKELINEVMSKRTIPQNPKAEAVDYVALNPFETTMELIGRALIKVLTEHAVIPIDEPHAEPQDTAIEVPSIEEQSEPDTEAYEEPSDESADELLFDNGDGENGAWQSSGVKISRSFISRVIQLDEVTKRYYSEIKNYLLSYKGVKSRISWKCETYKKGRAQLVKLKLRGKMILLYLAIDPTEADYSAYSYEMTDSKAYRDVPMMIKVKSDRGLNRAKRLIDILMSRFELVKDSKASSVNYSDENPYESTESLMDKGLVKILVSDREIKLDDRRGFSVSAIAKALASADVDLSNVDFTDVKDPVFVGTLNNPGKEVVSVVIPERSKNNKVYRYDPDGETLERGDVILVPRATSKGKRSLHKAAVTEGNHNVDAEKVEGPIEKIFGIVKRKIEEMLSK